MTGDDIPDLQGTLSGSCQKPVAIGTEKNRANLQPKCRPSVQRGAIVGIPELDGTVDRAHGDEAVVS